MKIKSIVNAPANALMREFQLYRLFSFFFLHERSFDASSSLLSFIVAFAI